MFWILSLYILYLCPEVTVLPGEGLEQKKAQKSQHKCKSREFRICVPPPFSIFLGKTIRWKGLVGQRYKVGDTRESTDGSVFNSTIGQFVLCQHLLLWTLRGKGIMGYINMMVQQKQFAVADLSSRFSKQCFNRKNYSASTKTYQHLSNWVRPHHCWLKEPTSPTHVPSALNFFKALSS